MKRYSFKKDLKKIFYILFVIISILTVFAVISFLILLPIYLVSKYHSDFYSLIVVCLILIIILFLIIKKIVLIWKKYKKLSFFILHLLTFLAIPLMLFAFFVIVETVIFRIFYEILPFLYATTAVISSNIILFVIFMIMRKAFFNIKLYLKNNQIKDRLTNSL